MAMSTLATLRATLKRITDDFVNLMATVSIRYFQRNEMAIVCPDFYWVERTPQQTGVQLQIKRSFDAWIERVKVAFDGAPDEVLFKLEEAETDFRDWLEFSDNNWSLKNDRAENERQIRATAATFDEILNVLEAGKNGGMVVVPDTNAIIKEPDPTRYRTLVGSDAFTFLLLPTVLSELDKLKNLHRNPDFRDKTEKVITRIKGWRKQGSLSTGVVIDQSIQVRALHNEPDMKSTLNWLDPAISDDRLIASVLEIQSAQPADRVILITGDINLQNKAEAATIEHSEL